MFIMTAVIGVCMAIVTLLGWLALSIDGILLGFVLWTAGNLRGSHRMRREGAALVVLSVLSLLAVFLFYGWLIWSVAALFVLGLIAARRRRLNQRALVIVLAAAAKANAPLVPALEAFSRDCPVRYGRRVRRLAARLAQGESLDQALGEEPRLLPAEHRIAARVGSETGQLSQALQESAAAQAAIEPLRHTVELRGLGALWILAGLGGVTLFLSIKIIPAFQRLLADFDYNAGMAATIRGLDAMRIEKILSWLLGAVVLLALVYAVRILRGASSLGPRLDAALVLRTLAFCTAKGLPIEGGLRAVADLHPRWRVRRRARGLLKRLAAGANWLDGLRSCRLVGAAEAAVLKAAVDAQNLTWAMRELAGSAERRHLYRRQMLRQITGPLTIVCLGLVAFGVVAACFLPLVEMIEELARRT
jgi:type II secretory pathway component PulF